LDFRLAALVGEDLYPVVVVLGVLVPAVFAVDQLQEYLPVADYPVPDDFAAACPVGLPELSPAVDVDQPDDFPLSAFVVAAVAVAAVFCVDHFSPGFEG
jgi:hypothetical protein